MRKIGKVLVQNLPEMQSKMKIILLSCLLLMFIGCQQISDLNGKTVEAQTVTNSSKNISDSNKAVNAISKDTNKASRETPALQVWVNIIKLKSLQNPDKNGDAWSNEKLAGKDGENNLNAAVAVDVLNCAGYLATGTLTKNDDNGWNFEIAPNSLAKDAVAKMKQCSTESSADESSLTTFAFAVAPSDNARRSIKVGKIDTRKLFASLPSATKNWLNSSYNIQTHTRRKNNLAIESNDDWTDTDGDGKIDLVEAATSCAVKSGETKCSSILYLINGKWTEIGYTKVG